MTEINKNFGFNSFFKEEARKLGPDSFSVARVISQHREGYKVKNHLGEYTAKITGKHIYQASTKEDFPVVGDWVAIEKIDNGQATIKAVLPRKTVIKRKWGDKNKSGEKDGLQIIASNVDTAFVVESVDRDYNLNRIERYLTIIKSGGIKPAIILNKVDLLNPDKLAGIIRQTKERFPNIDIIQTSIVSAKGLVDLKNYLKKGETYCFLGSSGVGKSSLINKLLGDGQIKTGGISDYSGRGKHTTTSRQMYFFGNGGIVIDNPGIREVGLADTGKVIDAVFDEIATLSQKCKYTNCSHVHEPGCEVIKAVKEGRIGEEQYSNYLSLKQEAEYYEMNDFDKRKKDKNWGKFMKKAKKDLEDIKYGN